MKKLTHTLLVITISSLTVFAQIPLKGLVAYYPFSGDANDYTDNNNNGTVNGATLTSDRFGNPNSAYSFDGLSNIIINSSEKLIIRNGTISLWFYTNSQSDQMILTKRNLVNASNQNYSLAFYQNQLDFQTNYNSNCNPAGAVHNFVTGNYSQKWHNLVAIIGPDSIKTYLDGNLKNSIVAPLNKADSCNGSPLLIGRTQDNNDWFKGSIDDIRIYNRTLTTSEIIALYNENSCSNYTSKIILPDYINTNGLIAYYPLNNDTKDYSGNNNNGINNGATLTTDRFGNPNSAYSFAGNNDYIEVSTASGKFNSQNYTISFWTKNNSLIGDQAFISRLKSSGDVYDNFCIFSAGGNANLNYLSTNNNMLSSANDGLGPNMLGNIWKHITITVASDSIKSYLNGNLVKKEKFIAGVNFNNSLPIRFGKASNPYWIDFSGELDDIRFYDIALTLSDINNLVNENVCVSNITVTDTLKISSISGINEIPENFGLVKVYPNPSKDLINIVASNPSSNYSIQIVNNLGTVVYTGSLSNPSIQVNLNTLGSKGIYIIKILDLSNNVLDNRKLVLE